MTDKKVALATLVLIIFYAVGLYGIGFSSNPGWFRALSPLNLLLTNVLLYSFHKTWNLSFLLFAAVALLAGFISELIGVHTGLLFGSYTYGSSLGPKLWGIPLVISLNWLLLVYITGIIVQRLPINWVLRALLAAALMTFLDMFIEPVASVLDFWTWEGYHIPVVNYWGWLGVGFLLQLYFEKANFKKQNPLALVVYALQLVFFISLNFCL